MRRREEGAAALEFAMVVPVLFLLMFGIIDFGLLFAQNLALSNSARRCAVRGGQQQQPHLRRRRAGGPELSQAAGGIPSAGVTVRRGSSSATAINVCGSSATKPCTGSQPTDNIYVTLAFDANIAVPMPALGSTKRLSGEGVFRCEFS